MDRQTGVNADYKLQELTQLLAFSDIIVFEFIMNNRDEVEVTVAIFTEPEVTNCFSTIALVIIRENKIKFL